MIGVTEVCDWSFDGKFTVNLWKIVIELFTEKYSQRTCWEKSAGLCMAMGGILLHNYMVGEDA